MNDATLSFLRCVAAAEEKPGNRWDYAHCYPLSQKALMFALEYPVARRALEAGFVDAAPWTWATDDTITHYWMTDAGRQLLASVRAKSCGGPAQ